MSSDISNPRRVWPWGKPLPRFESPQEEQAFWATHEVEGPPPEVGGVVVSEQSRWMPRAHPFSSASWAGAGGLIGAALGSFFGVAGAAIGGGVGAAMAAYVLAVRSGHGFREDTGIGTGQPRQRKPSSAPEQDL